MKLVGNLIKGATAVTLASDKKRVNRHTFPVACSVPKLTLYLDGLGAGVGDQVAKAVIYDSGGDLVAQGDEVTVLDGQVVGWVDFPFATLGGVPLAAAAYDLGLIAGEETNVIRTYADALVGQGNENTDTYTDGAASTFGGSTVLDQAMSVFATYITPWVQPNATNEHYARLPFEEAQSILGQGAAVATYQGDVGWHGTRIDPERGSFCIARSEGPLAGLVGERVRITSLLQRARSVVAYVHSESSELLDDLSLTRRLFAELDLLALDSVSVRVEVLE